MGDADTIVALASAPGRSGISVLRLSGPEVSKLMQAVTGRALAARVASFCRFRDANGETIDDGIALYFPAPRSYTGEDVLELHSHGGTVVPRRLLKRCLELGARMAQPGEYTRRAFLNDKLDLAQAEAVADLIDASSEQAARSAIRSLHGEFSGQVAALQEGLTGIRVRIEAGIDFPEEEIEFLHASRWANPLEELGRQIDSLLAAGRQGSILRDGVRVAIIGPPNSGKSSIINALSKDDVAIVSAIPGTTRDLIRQSLEIQGLPVHVVDTAGLREAEDLIEKLGITRAWEAASQADIALLVADLGAGPDSELEKTLSRLPRHLRLIMAYNKIDLVGQDARSRRTPQGGYEVWLSAKTGAGVELLEAAIAEVAGWESGTEGLFIARERHLRALRECRSCISTAIERIPQDELVAEELRLAQLALSQLTGEVASNDLLGEIFARFCIGK